MRAIFYPGNPGFIEDLAEVQKYLKSQLEWDNTSTASLKDTIVVGFSFGAYRALKAIESSPDKPKALILIAPFIKPDSKLSPVAKILMGISFLRDRIVSKSYLAWKKSLFERMFHSSELSLPVVHAFVKKLEPMSVWREVVVNKLKQESYPASIQIVHFPVLTISSDDDAISPSRKVTQDLESLGIGFENVKISSASHGMPMTCPIEIAKQIDLFLNQFKE